MAGVAPITSTVEMKQPIYFIDGNPMISVASSYIHSIDKWDDVSADVLVSKQWLYSRGINGIKPTSLVASPGKFTFSLKIYLLLTRHKQRFLLFQFHYPYKNQ